jgi:hypothetical protein
MISFSMAWQAPEFEERDRDVSWYWISIIAAAIFIAFAVWQRNFLFGLFIIIAELLIIVWAGQKPRTISFSVSEKKLTIDEKKEYAMNDFENFSVDEKSNEAFDCFFFYAKTKLRPLLPIIVPKNMTPDLRKNLKTGMKEVEYQPSLIDSLEKIIGF